MNKPSILNKGGIYKITNIINNKIYIGSSKNIRKRWKAHRHLLKNGKHYNKYLMSAYNKYGSKNFIWEVLEFIEYSNLQNREQYWIDFFKSSDRTVGYNLCPNAYSNLGVKHTNESRLNMSLSHIGNKHSSESKQKISKSQYKIVYQFDLQGNFIAKYPSILDAEKKTGTRRQLISGCCRGITKTANKYFWSLKKKYIQYIKNNSRKAPWKCKKIQCSESLKMWKSIKDATVELNLSRNQISSQIKKGTIKYV